MENPQSRSLQKWWKFCTISKCAKKIFFWKILCSTHQKKCFLAHFEIVQNFHHFCKGGGCGFSVKNSIFQKNALKIVETLLLGQVWYLIVSIPDLCNLTYFLLTFRLFLKKWIFDGKSTVTILTKMVKVLYYLKMC